MNRNTVLTYAIFVIQMLASVAGLMIAKYWLPQLRDDWQANAPLLPAGMMVVLGGSLYATSFVLWLFVLTRLELTLAYPIYVGITMVLTAFGAALFLGESVTTLKTIGTALIFVGATCLLAR